MQSEKQTEKSEKAEEDRKKRREKCENKKGEDTEHEVGDMERKNPRMKLTACSITARISTGSVPITSPLGGWRRVATTVYTPLTA